MKLPFVIPLRFELQRVLNIARHRTFCVSGDVKFNEINEAA